MDKAKAYLKVVEDFIVAHPYVSVYISFAVGAVVGAFLVAI